MLFLMLLACSTSDTPSGGPGARPPARVEVDAVRSGGLSDSWRVLGEVRALERAELAAGAAGSVDRVDVREGDAVRSGDLLLEVDPSLASAELAAARAEVRRLEAELEQARRTTRRVEEVGDVVLGADELERAKTGVVTLEAQLDGARAAERLAGARLERHRVRAPFDGIVAGRQVDRGDWVQVGTPVLEVVRTDGVEVRVDAPLELAAALSPGDAVGLADGRSGRIAGVVPALDPVSRTAVVRVEPVGDAGLLVPGSPIDVVFDVQRADGLLVPRDALVQGPTATRVFVVEEGTARAIEVEPVATTADTALLRTDALAVGDRVVVRGNERLRPDQAVTVTP